MDAVDTRVIQTIYGNIRGLSLAAKILHISIKFEFNYVTNYFHIDHYYSS